jgi:hypothetical protein
VILGYLEATSESNSSRVPTLASTQKVVPTLASTQKVGVESKK